MESPKQDPPRHIQFIVELVMGYTFSGDNNHRELCMMMLNSQQGSTGLEESLCEILGITKIADKHGFDAIDDSGTYYELKPTKDIKKMSVTYNDITDKKINSMRNCENIFVFATIESGELTFLATVDGKLIATLLQESYYKVAIVNKKRMEDGGQPRRASLQISLFNIVKTFTNGSINVLYFKLKSNTAKRIHKYLPLTSDINKLPTKYVNSGLTYTTATNIVDA